MVILMKFFFKKNHTYEVVMWHSLYLVFLMYSNCYAALPVMVETVSRKILEHITDQCLVCCDVGIPCSARQDCSDPSSLIFPFQVCICQ
jgi:hypothetical protein